MLEVSGDLALTIGAFAFGRWVVGRTGGHPAANATLIAIVLVILGLLVRGRSYGAYIGGGGGAIAFLLGPATVALGIPLARNAASIRRDALPVAGGVLAGALVAAVAGPVLLRVFGGSEGLALSMAPKAVTTPIAMGIASQVGGVAVLAAVFAIIGGVIVAVCVGPVMRVIGVDDHRVFGLAAGVAGSGIGAAQAIDRHPDAGAYAALAVGVNSVLTAILVPLLAALHLL